ncbi:MAG TPA: hypothetical protein DDY78_24250 [Planctomycetales bacterium]|nr:hypothetical protein [Planctomycetales bacterium]
MSNAKPIWSRPKRFLILAGVLVVGFATTVTIMVCRRTPMPETTQETWQPSDADAWWYVSPDLPFNGWQEWTETPKMDVFEVSKEVEAQAVARLDERPIIQLSVDEFRLYTGQPFPAPEKQQPYLVRSVLFENTNGARSFLIKGSILWARYDCLGRPGRRRKSPVIVLLLEKPRNLFVSGGWAL